MTAKRAVDILILGWLVRISIPKQLLQLYLYTDKDVLSISNK
jgi:hypothetical protein